jgi:hypothetical protein
VTPSDHCPRIGESLGLVPIALLASNKYQLVRRELSEPPYHREDLPELGASALLLAWRPRLDELRPELKAVRRAIE